MKSLRTCQFQVGIEKRWELSIVGEPAILTAISIGFLPDILANLAVGWIVILLNELYSLHGNADLHKINKRERFMRRPVKDKPRIDVHIAAVRVRQKGNGLIPGNEIRAAE